MNHEYEKHEKYRYRRRPEGPVIINHAAVFFKAVNFMVSDLSIPFYTL